MGEYFFREIKYVYIRARKETLTKDISIFQRDDSVSSVQPYAA